MFHVELNNSLARLLDSGARRFGLVLSSDQIAALLVYLRELQAWNEKFNLTTIIDGQDIVVKHFLDSLACVKVFNRGGPSGRLLDIGSGAGCPGLPICIAMPRLDVTLLEPNQKKVAFLRHIIGTLDLRNVEVIAKRIQEYAEFSSQAVRYRYLVVRAIKIEHIQEHLSKLIQSGGELILFQGKAKEINVKVLNFIEKSSVSYNLPLGYGIRTLSVFEYKPTT
jgi:16S rRNA (guanine527-N7)-methyltransferase